jgi:hypothetical protein
VPVEPDTVQGNSIAERHALIQDISALPYMSQLSLNQLEHLAGRLSADENTALSKMLQTLESNAQWALGVAQAEDWPLRSGVLGTKAHNDFEELNYDYLEELRQDLKRSSTRLDLVPEYFATDGEPKPIRHPGSKGVDVLITLDGHPLLGVDLKSGRPWSAKSRAKIEGNIRAPTIQIGPRVR